MMSETNDDDGPKERGVWSYVLAGLSGGLLLVVVGLAVLLFAYAGWQFIGAIFGRKDKKAKQIADAAPPSGA